MVGRKLLLVEAGEGGYWRTPVPPGKASRGVPCRAGKAVEQGIRSELRSMLRVCSLLHAQDWV